jgi:outer membrane murein-binding lipoprotein Lpp
MKNALLAILACILPVADLAAQDAGKRVQPQHDVQLENRQKVAEADSEDVRELNADLQRLKALLNQMRTNLAFVQSSQTPLKHQFELEADAWQVIVEQMDRRLKRMEERLRESAR